MAGPTAQPNRRLLAVKALSLAVGLSGHARHVGCILLDHYNDDTGRCDPSVSTIAGLIGVSDKSVFRALDEICDRDDGPDTGKPFVRAAHQGVRNTTSYGVRWQVFDAMLKGWEAHRDSFRRGARAATKPCQKSPVDSPDTVTGDRMSRVEDTDTSDRISAGGYGHPCPLDTDTRVRLIRSPVTDKPLLLTQTNNPYIPLSSPKGLSPEVRSILLGAMSASVADGILADRHAGGAPVSVAEAQAIAAHVRAYDDHDAAAIALVDRNYRGVLGLRRVRRAGEERKLSRTEAMIGAFDEMARSVAKAGPLASALSQVTGRVHPQQEPELWAVLERRAGRKLKAFSSSGTKDFPLAEVMAAREELARGAIAGNGGGNG